MPDYVNYKFTELYLRKYTEQVLYEHCKQNVIYFGSGSGCGTAALCVESNDHKKFLVLNDNGKFLDVIDVPHAGTVESGRRWFPHSGLIEVNEVQSVGEIIELLIKTGIDAQINFLNQLNALRSNQFNNLEWNVVFRHEEKILNDLIIKNRA